MKLLQWILFAYTVVNAYVTSNTCIYCKTTVKETEDMIAQYGCSFLVRAKIIMFCLSVELEKDILYDQCVPLLSNGCDKIQVYDPEETCTSLQMC